MLSKSCCVSGTTGGLQSANPLQALAGQPKVATRCQSATTRQHRRFDVEVPDKVWVTDITRMRINESFAYLAVVIDLYCRRVVGLLPAV
jgi:transposase InsO family protein